ncbi:flagellar basal body P-ring formation chaperone FlgA [Mangrovicoccus algicola]|uniref:Flagella basal body P-ring formation protein FlgA n=1 Tax=Mangrovicoccus algicola TaxID=2771008 RepID=A0A8J6Z241_9RHOB|nr:flagellar basal body P-ring formation chaperone FlgA [Mangrovicoccus algicola]MBE3640221.1 flagellar basal body P-ring formation protein FlgA [Mangrovicoccus algicola]
MCARFAPVPVLALLAALAPAGVPRADSVVTARPVRVGTVLTAEDVALQEVEIPGALGDLREAVGLQASRNLFPGRAIMPADLQEPHVVSRNQTVLLHFERGALRISTEGRALDGGAPGDMIRVTNETSRITVTGKVMPDGSITVTGADR